MTSIHTADRPVGRALKRPILLAGSLFLASAIVWSCAGQAAAVVLATSQATRSTATSSDAAAAATSFDAFGFDLYGKLLTPDGNGVLSPASVALALSMAQAGAHGDTAAQMETVLHGALSSGGGNGINSLDQALTQLSGVYPVPGTSDQKLTLRIANSPFAQSGEQWQQAYLDTLAGKFGAGLRLVDYKTNSDGACKAINGWVSDQTEGRIPKLLDSLDPLTRLVLVNAIYLKAPWLKAFDESSTTDAPFTRLGGSPVNVPTMSSNLSDAAYASGSGWQAVEIPYINQSLAMTIVVPDNLAEFEKGLNSARFAQITGSLQHNPVDLTMPRFKIETKSELSAALSSLGMPLAFDPDKADFSGMTAEERLYIAKVVHQANISVDEKGTEASAATAVVMADMMSAPAGAPITMHVDKPFLFAIRDTTTGAILFLGRVTDPSA